MTTLISSENLMCTIFKNDFHINTPIESLA